MGSVSASHLVIFIASVVVAAAVAGTLVTEVDQVSQSVTDQSADVSESIQTDVQIISDKSNQTDAIYDDGANNVTLLVKNTGSTELTARSDAVDLLVEGRFITPENVTVELVEAPEETAWSPGSVIEVRVDLNGTFDSLDGPTRVSVVVNDNEDTIRFRA